MLREQIDLGWAGAGDGFRLHYGREHTMTGNRVSPDGPKKHTVARFSTQVTIESKGDAFGKFAAGASG